MLKLIESDLNRANPVPDNEAERQAKVDEYNILDTLPEEEFDSLVELAALITDSPFSLVNIIDYNRQWTKAAFGIKPGKSIPRSESICHYTIMYDGNFEIEDLILDKRFKELHDVKNNLNFRSYNGYPLKTTDGFNLGSLCVLDTKPKKLSKTQKKALRTIANEIIARFDLRREQFKLEQLNKEKDQFLRAVNHDIKSPINGIVSSAHYLQHQWEGEQDELFEFLSMIELSGRKLINYTSELMSNTLLKNESKLHIEEVVIEDLIEDLIHIYAPLAKAKDIEIQVSHDTSTVFKIDDEKLKLILSNLISNALKFSRKGDVIRVKSTIFSKIENKLQTLHCSVSDTGMGIPKNFIPTLFTKSKKHQRQGTQGEISTGMGLPIVKQFVDLHGGGIKVDTEEGKGTTFHVVIPEQNQIK